MKYIFFIGVFYVLSCGTTGRKVSNTGSVHSNQGECLKYFQNGNWKQTLACLENVPDSSRDQAYFDLRGTTLIRSGNVKGAVTAFGKALDLDINGENPYLYFKHGESLWQDHQFLSAGRAMQTYLRMIENPKPAIRRKADYYIRSARIADSLYRRPREFDPVPLSDSINTNYDELGISMTYDRRQLILTRRTNQEDLYQSEFRNGQWRKATPMNSLNTLDNEGAAALSGDGNLLVFTACQRPNGVGSCDLYISKWQDTGWSQPELMPGINSRYWDSQPTLSADGRAIIFSSERPGGSGGRDLWLSVQDVTGWIEPVNLGASINSPGNEENPFLHTDEFTLYFTSDHWPGFGGRDLFMAHRIRGNEWSDPQNLGYPLNSIKNEEGIFIESSGQKGYFSSERDDQFDLYHFQLDTAIQPEPALLYEMIVLDSLSGNRLEDVSVKVYDWTNDRMVRTGTTDAEGYAAFIMSGDRDYGITVFRDDFSFYSYRKHVGKEVAEDVTDTIRLTSMKISKTMVLENVHFASGEARLLSASHVELDQLTHYLLKNPDLRIKLTGHTDNVGKPVDNLVLSQKRAEAVKKYLTGKGVKGNRIQAEGAGETEPIAPNSTSEGRQKNRRTEINIIDN